MFGDVVLLEKFQMGMFREVLSAEVDGKPIPDPQRFEYPPAEHFHRTMSEKYSELAEVHEEFAKFESLTRLAGLAKGLTEAETKPDLSYWLERYQPVAATTPEKVPVLP